MARSGTCIGAADQRNPKTIAASTNLTIKDTDVLRVDFAMAGIKGPRPSTAIVTTRRSDDNGGVAEIMTNKLDYGSFH